MNNLDFLKKIIMSTDEYWIVARGEYSRQYGNTVKGKDSILFIAIPKGIRRGLKYEDIMLKDIEIAKSSIVSQNIFINRDYPPFQDMISMYDIYDGYPVEKNSKEFLQCALALKSDFLWDYKKLIEELEPTEEVSNEIL